GGSLTFFDIARFDNLIYRGTDLNDTFTVNPAGQVFLNTQIVVNTPSIITLTLAGLAGDDTFNVPGNNNFPLVGAIEVQGGDPSASDTINFTGSGGAVDVDLAAQTVTEFGFAPVSFTGVEVLNVSAGGGAITVFGTTRADNVTVTPTGANTATLTAAGLNLT